MSIPFALSLSKYVNSTGTDVGFASLLGVALLALLYFAGSRETRTLRDQLEEAHSRITALEARLAQSLRNQAARANAPAGPSPAVPGRPGVVAAPSVPGPMGTAVARLQREAAGSTAPGVPVGAAAAMAAPALGSATKLVPTPDVVPVGVPEPVPSAAPVPTVTGAPVPVAASVPAAATYAGSDDDEFDEEFGPEDTLFVPATTAAAGNGAGRGGGGPFVTAPPRVQLYDDDAESSGPLPRRTIPVVDTGPSRSRVLLGRVGGSIAAVVVVAVIVVALLLITSSGGKHHSVTAQRTHTQTTARHKTPVFQPSKVKVSVLNGTALNGLAGDIGDKLTSAGYKVPAASITNDGSDQLVSNTTVSYRQGYGNAAIHIADALHSTYGIAIPLTTPATALTITNCATPPDTGVVGTCPADVIVIVGSDLSGAADSTTSSSSD